MNLEYIILISITIVLVLITAWQFSRIRVLMKSLSSLKLELIQSTDIIKKLYAKDYAKRHQWTDEEIKKSKEAHSVSDFSFNKIKVPDEAIAEKYKAQVDEMKKMADVRNIKMGVGSDIIKKFRVKGESDEQ